MRRYAYLFLILVGLAAGSLWILPDLAQTLRVLVVGVPPRGPGPGIAVTCEEAAEESGFWGISLSEAGKFRTIVKFVQAGTTPTDVCDTILNIAIAEKLRGRKERSATIVIYGSGIDVYNQTKTRTRVEKF